MSISSSPDSQDMICHICGQESICEGLGVIRYDVSIDDPRFGKLFRCPNNPIEMDAERQNRLRRLSNLDAYKEKNFYNFEIASPTLKPFERDSLQMALNTAVRYAENPTGWLLIEGSYGCGKTHLAAAVGNQRLQSGDVVLFITAPDLLDHLRSAYGPTSETTYDESFERVRNAPFLILDDLGSESPSPWAQEKLYQLFNHRYSLGLPTVITTNVDPDRLDPRIRSRLLDTNLVRQAKIVAPDFRTYRLNQHDQLSSLALYKDMSFENFNTRTKATPQEKKDLENALKGATHYAEHPEGWIVFSAAHGCGKTHLAAAIAHRLQDKGTDVIFITVPDLLDYLRDTFNPTAPVSFDQRFQMMKNAPLLVLDHLDMEGSTWAKEKLFQILDYRYVTRRPTIITTAVPVNQIDARLQVRMADSRRCTVIPLNIQSYSARMNN